MFTIDFTSRVPIYEQIWKTLCRVMVLNSLSYGIFAEHRFTVIFLEIKMACIK